MKTKKNHRCKGLTKAEEKWLRAQQRRAVIAALLTLVAGALVIAVIFKMAGSAV